MALKSILHRVAGEVGLGEGRRSINHRTGTHVVVAFAAEIVATGFGGVVEQAIAGLAVFGGVVVGQHGHVFGHPFG